MTIDFGKFLNHDLGKNVQSERNAVVDLINILGPREILSSNKDISRALMQELAIKPIPADGKFFVPWSDFCRGLHLTEAEFDDLYYDDFRNCYFDPWTEKQKPQVKAWLEVNEQWSSKIRRALQKEQFYYPAWPSKAGLPNAGAVVVSNSMFDLERYLGVSAMHAIAHGRYDTAIQHAESIYRLGHLYAKGKSWRNKRSAESIHRYFLYVVRRIAQSNVQKSQLRQMREFIESNSFETNYQDNVISIARIECRDLIKHLAEPDREFFLETFDVEIDRDNRNSILRLLYAVHWHEVAGECSRWFDDFEKVISSKPYSRKEWEFKRFKKRLDRFIGDPWTGQEIWKTQSKSPQEKSKWLARILMRDHFPIIDNGSFTLDSVENWSNQSLLIYRDLTLLALSVEEYRKDHGKYPFTLSKLQPTYIKAIPADPFAGSIWLRQAQAFKYKIVGTDYRLYSIGADREDHFGDSLIDIVVGASTDPDYHN